MKSGGLNPKRFEVDFSGKELIGCMQGPRNAALIVHFRHYESRVRLTGEPVGRKARIYVSSSAEQISRL